MSTTAAAERTASEPVPSLDPSATPESETPARVAAASPAAHDPAQPPAYCRLAGEAIFYTATDWLRWAYAQGGGTPEGACGSPGDRSWCSADIPGAAFNDLWLDFASWG